MAKKTKKGGNAGVDVVTEVEVVAEVEVVTLMIDDQEITVPKGTTVLQAAQGVGTEVPHYCYHPGLSSPAMCRL